MGHPVLTAASTLVCAHGASVLLTPRNPRVTAAGSPVLCLGDPAIVDACHDPSPCGSLGLSGCARVRASGQPLAIGPTAVSLANGTAAVVVWTQWRVVAS